MKKSRQIICAITAASALTTSAATAFAGNDRVCAPHETVSYRLNQSFGETRQLVGYTKFNHAVEVFASAKTGTWTMTVTKAGGLTCLVSSGNEFDKVSNRFARL